MGTGFNLRARDGFTATEILSVTAGTAAATRGRPPEVCGFGPTAGAAV